ncbi:type II secretion system protein [Lactobacillus hominis]|uniref:type II secretion system protein n=1 Tax=Lactobacillus hominis TaxID=1203033 RepID=UPI0023F4E7C8|nr:type II secretion system protein [Lactobacillus hominis]
MRKIKGFLLWESMIGLFIACLGITLLSLTVGQGKEVERKMEKKVDEKMAYYIMRKTGESEVLIHDQVYK